MMQRLTHRLHAVRFQTRGHGFDALASHPVTAALCSSSSKAYSGPHAPRRSPGPLCMPRSASLVGLARRGVIPQNKFIPKCFFCDPVVLNVTVSGVAALPLGDFDGDGNLDIAVWRNAARGTGSPLSVTVLLGDGAGNFRAGRASAGLDGGLAITSLTSGDFNGDGKPDLAVGFYGAEIAILLGDGAGGFAVPSYTPVGSLVGELVAGDFNGEGKLDLAVSLFGYAPGACAVMILLGNGTGNPNAVSSFSAGPVMAVGIEAGDFNGDGNLDVATANEASSFVPGVNTVTVFLCDGTGQFAPAASQNAAGNLLLAAGDFNGDGRLDFATAGNLLLQSAGPLCSITAIVTGPPKQLQVTMQDVGSGLKTIQQDVRREVIRKGS